MTPAARDRLLGRAMAAPALAALVVALLLPALLTLATSAFERAPLPDPGAAGFVGLRNHLAALGDAGFRRSLLVTLALAGAAIGLELLAGLALALALAAVGRGRGVYLAILVAPLALGPVVVGLAWRALLDPAAGPAGWLASTSGAFWALVAADAWHHVALTAVLLLAGLAAVPRGLHEAARMEGAGAVRRFFHVTLPLLWPAIGAALLIRLVLALRAFDLVHVLTRGGPGGATDTVSRLAFERADPDLGGACAMAAILLLLVLPPTALLHRHMRPPA